MSFSIDSNKVEYKSYSSSLMKFIFSHSSVCTLYDKFIQEKHLIQQLVTKRIKVSNEKVKSFYYVYGINLHNIYSMESEMLCSELLEFADAGSVNMGNTLDLESNVNNEEINENQEINLNSVNENNLNNNLFFV